MTFFPKTYLLRSNTKQRGGTGRVLLHHKLNTLGLDVPIT